MAEKQRRQYGNGSINKSDLLWNDPQLLSEIDSSKTPKFISDQIQHQSFGAPPPISQNPYSPTSSQSLPQDL